MGMKAEGGKLAAQKGALLTNKGYDTLLDDFADRLTNYWQRIKNEPQFNPVKQLAFEISRSLEAGALSLDDIAGLMKILSDRALMSRANGTRAYIGAEALSADNVVIEGYRQFVRRVAGADGDRLEFEAFKTRFENPQFGIVFTAHPTFAMPEKMRALLVKLIEDPAHGTSEDFKADLKPLTHAPDPDISLSDEQAQVQVALAHASEARRVLHRVLLEEAEKLYPDEWLGFTPNVATLNSWVGYDLDGRTDIRWHDSLLFRLIEKKTQLERHQAAIKEVVAQIEGDEAKAAAHLAAGVELITQECDALTNAIDLFSCDLETPQEISAAANYLTNKKGSVLAATIEPLLQIIITAGGEVSGKDAQRAIALLLTEVKAAGLTTSNIHLRINAMQVHNGIRKPLGEGVVDLNSHVNLTKIDTMIRHTAAESINFANLALERSTAVRQFMVIAQILKHIDGDAPIRLLIAECEHALTVLSALYFAKLFGIEDKVDISPLFETERALERGADIIKQLLKFDSYRSYIEKRGRLSIQTGFSDAGRFFGQIPAALAVERLQRRLASILRDAGMRDIEVVLFNTHGESMGRGAHPGSLEERFDYLLSPYVRNAFLEKGLKIYHEVSFQGGDGYVFFGSKALARATLSQFLMSGKHDGQPLNDAFYSRKDFREDLFEHVKLYQSKLFENKNYQTSLGAFETNLLFKTGSRKTKRQFDGRQDDRVAAAKMRAIPHNALLQQMGFLANVVSGFGTAIRDDKDQFARFYEQSPRLRTLIGMILRARQHSSVKSLVAYATVFNDAFWVTRPIEDMEAPLKGPCLLLADLLRDDLRHDRLMHLATYLREDDIYLHDLFTALGQEEWQGQADGHERDEIVESDMMHAIRIALIMHIYLLGGRLPVFSARNDVTHKDIMNMVLSLRIEDAVQMLKEAYPRAVPERSHYAVDEPASYTADEGSDFEELNDTLIDPMVRAYQLLREVGVGLGHHFRAHG